MSVPLPAVPSEVWVEEVLHDDGTTGLLAMNYASLDLVVSGTTLEVVQALELAGLVHSPALDSFPFGLWITPVHRRVR